MKIGLAQLNTTVGDLAGNLAKAVKVYDALVAAGADLVLFPELAITGYPPRDLLFKSKFVADNLAALNQFAQRTGSVPAVIGFVDRNRSERGRRFLNAAAWCEHGEVQQVFHKSLLPTYDVFDEDRYFETASTTGWRVFKGVRWGVTICEDIWSGPIVETSRHYSHDPVKQLAEAKVDVLLNLSASPWHYGKDSTRFEVVRQAAERVGCPVVYANAVGGNDELIFDGHSMVVSSDGSLLAGLAPFAEDSQVVDLNSDEIRIHPKFRQEELADIFDALVLGLRDYALKSGFKRALIGLSGGIDSALTAVLAAHALGRENVIGVSLPSAISSDHSKTDASDLARNLGIVFHTLPIAEVVTSAETALQPIIGDRPRDVTEENIQARSRGLLLMALSNKLGALLLTTGNKSEIAVGYCTLYGDMCGGLAVISDLPKVKVFALCEWINREQEIIPWNTIRKPPSAELRPDQKDEDSLPPYPVLDAILKLYVEEGKSAAEIIGQGFAEAVVRDVIRKVDLNEYKRKQAAPGLKVTPLAFGVGRRIPIVQKYVS
ncbi:MAG: NAD+ synthase [Verrucomicrobia bacterium]|nr:NAD+ synthase [Verrucomicrobiota bacterium]